MRIFKTPSLLKKLFPDFVWDKYKEKPASPTLYLTFDDGPIPEVTEFVIDTLEQYQAKATFFCVGDNVSKHPEIFRLILEKGHRVANHTYNHLNGWKNTTEDYLENTLKCSQVLSGQSKDFSVFNEKKDLFRPPYGRITSGQYRVLKDQFQLIMWDVLTNDYDSSLEKESCLKNSVKVSKSGSIVVFHDSLKAEKNVRYVLPRYLGHFAALGFNFEKL